MIKIIYPYIKSKWGEELKYSLRSLEENFTEPYEVWIMGDLPDYIHGVTHIPTYNKNFVQVNKCRLFDLAQSFPEEEDFIWMNDDFYLLKPMDREVIGQYFYLSNVANLKTRGKTRWHQTFFTTMDFCKELGFTQFNFECHIPMLFNVQKLLLTFERFEELHKWAIISAYRNMHMDYKKLTQLGRKKVGFYSPKTNFRVHRESLFMNHDDKGLLPEVKKYLKDRFPVPSRYEK